MYKWMTTATALGCAAFCLTVSPAFAQLPYAPAPLAHEPHATPAQKQASDQAMQAGLSELKAAAGATQQSTGGQVMQDLQAAEADFSSAMPIYQGHREEAMHATVRAMDVVQKNKKNARARSATELAKAISDAQTALQVN
jgi:chorismate mutase